MNLEGTTISGKIYFLLLDGAIFAMVPFIALLLRLDGNVNSHYFDVLINVIGLAVLFKLIIGWGFGLYNLIWRYVTVRDMFAIMGACFIGNVAVGVLGLWVHIDLPRSIYILSCLFDIGFICFFRLLVRMLSFMNAEKELMQEEQNNILIVGAGDAGVMIAREIIQRGEGKRIAGFIDDDINKIGKRLLGYKILGSREQIEDFINQLQVQEIIIAMPSVAGNIIKNILDCCHGTGAKIRVLPGLYELIEGKVFTQQLRDISLEDLLRRESVSLDIEALAKYLQDKVVLVTGAGGSIGSELCRQISIAKPKTLLLLGRGENSIYEIHQELMEKLPGNSYMPLIADVRDGDRIEEIFAKYHPEVIFHAAAHKHVPLMEAQPAEAVKNNIFGTYNVALAADKYKAEAFVMISTDKAVNPTSVMGASKRIAELLVQKINQKSQTKFATVRFGNVLGSRGSVVPLFKKQIAKGGPITITDPKMVRYFMTIPEAAQLVLQAGSFSKGGEVFLLDMGEPVRILDMAKDLVVLHGLVPDKDIKFVFTGLRPGEKLYEELLTAEEGTKKTHHARIFQAPLNMTLTEEAEKRIMGLREEKDIYNILHTFKALIPTFNNANLKEMEGNHE